MSGKTELVSVVATLNTDAVVDKKGNVTQAGSSQQVRLDPNDKGVIQAVEKALKDQDKK